MFYSTTTLLFVLCTFPGVTCKKPSDLVDYSYQGLTSVPRDIPSNTRRLHLQQNDIAYIRPGQLAHLSKCRELNLAYNRLREVRRDMLQGLYSLDELDLSYNEITMVLPGSFSDLENLEVLSLTGNALTTLEEDVFRTSDNQIRHPRDLELALDGNPLHCDRRMCWVRRGERAGWVRFQYKYGWVPECVNHPNTPWQQVPIC